MDAVPTFDKELAETLEPTAVKAALAASVSPTAKAAKGAAARGLKPSMC